MLFQYTLDLVLSGRKTQTCRVAKPGESAVRASDGQIAAVTLNGRDKYRVGKTYAVQPARGKPEVARIRLLALERKNVAEINAEEAQAEGYASRAAFFDVWRTIHGEKRRRAEVWVLKFALVKQNTES